MSKIYKMITDRIVDLLEQGTVPWRKPWKGGHQPKNLISNNSYRGINNILLACAPYGSPWWVTFRQAKKLEGTVRKGEKGFPVIFWKPQVRLVEDENGDTEVRQWPLLRYYTVFNVEQCEGLDHQIPPETEATPTFKPIDQAEAVVKAMPAPPSIRHDQPSAFYRPATDLVNMPKPELFTPPEEYYSTLFHELIHATGHESRLARSEVIDTQSFGSHSYSREELVAEFGSCFLCGHTGIEAAVLENSASYINGWMRRLKQDKCLVINAAAKAQKAADWILGRFPDQPAEENSS